MSQRSGGVSILEHFSAETADRIQRFRHFAEISSTNSWLLGSTPPPAGRICVAIADHQTAGRGRLQRRWHTQPGSGICLSLAYTFESPRAELAGLTVAVGVGIADALRQIGARDISLKWPNDVMAGGRKLAGVLAEARHNGDDKVSVVVGMGINLSLAEMRESESGQAWLDNATDLESCCRIMPGREKTAADLVDGMAIALATFDTHGLSPFIGEWRDYDYFRGKPVVVDMLSGDGSVKTAGVADGIDEDGALILQTASGMQRIVSGSVRPDMSADAA